MALGLPSLTLQTVFDVKKPLFLPGISQQYFDHFNQLFCSLNAAGMVIEAKFPSLRNVTVLTFCMDEAQREKQQDLAFKQKLRNSLEKYRSKYPQQSQATYAMHVLMRGQRLLEKELKRRTAISLIASGSFLEPEGLQFTSDRWLLSIIESDPTKRLDSEMLSHIKGALDHEIRRVHIHSFLKDAIDAREPPHETKRLQSYAWQKFAQMAFDHLHRVFITLFPSGLDPMTVPITLEAIEIALGYHLTLLYFLIERMKWCYFPVSLGKQFTPPQMQPLYMLVKELGEAEAQIQKEKQQPPPVQIAQNSPEWALFYDDLKQLSQIVSNAAALMQAMVKTAPGKESSQRLYAVGPFSQKETQRKGFSNLSGSCLVVGCSSRSGEGEAHKRPGKGSAVSSGEEWDSLVFVLNQGAKVVTLLADNLREVKLIPGPSIVRQGSSPPAEVPHSPTSDQFVDAIDYADPHASQFLGYFYELTGYIELLLRGYLAAIDDVRPAPFIDKFLQHLRDKSEQEFNSKILPILNLEKERLSQGNDKEDQRIQKLWLVVTGISKEYVPRGKYTLSVVQDDLITPTKDLYLKEIYHSFSVPASFKAFKAQLRSYNLRDGLRIHLGDEGTEQASVVNTPEASFWNKLFTYIRQKEQEASLKWDILLTRSFKAQEHKFKTAYSQTDFTDEWFHSSELVEALSWLQQLVRLTRLSFVPDHRHPIQQSSASFETIEGQLKKIEVAFKRTPYKLLDEHEQRQRWEAAIESSASQAEYDMRTLQQAASANLTQAVKIVYRAVENVAVLHGCREEAKKAVPASSSPRNDSPRGDSPRNGSPRSCFKKGDRKERRSVTIVADCQAHKESSAASIMKLLLKTNVFFHKSAQMVLSLPIPRSNQKK